MWAGPQGRTARALSTLCGDAAAAQVCNPCWRSGTALPYHYDQAREVPAQGRKADQG